MRAGSRYSGRSADKRQAAAFDLTAIRRGQAEDPQIYPGDIVVVDGSAIKATQKQILQSIPFLGLQTLSMCFCGES